MPKKGARIMELDHLKKLGFGTLHLPILDPKDQSSFDYAALNREIDMFLDHGFTYLILLHLS